MEITRAELYERVCGSPLSKIAPQLGVSGTALAAVCKKYQIPYPGSGYWTRQSLGLPVELPPLPGGDDQVITIVPAKPKKRSVAPKSKGDRQKAPAVAKPARASRHPLLVGVEIHFRKSRDIGDGEFLKPYKRILPDIVASEPQLAKALDIANELYLALDTRDYRVSVASTQEKLRRIQISEQEMALKDRRYGRYYSGGIWAPDRPTVTYIGSVAIGLALTEMTERVTMRYINGTYYREDSKAVKSAKSWQLTNSWTTEQDLSSGRFRLVAYSPVSGVDWVVNWQETTETPMLGMIPAIVRKLEGSKNELVAMVADAERAEAKRQKELDEMWERHRRQEDQRRVAQALTDSRQQLTEIIDKWGKAMTVERFFMEAQARLQNVADERHSHLKERLAQARAMLGTLDPLDFLGEWVAPEERYQSKYK